MPLAATSTRAACAQIHVALNGQQYADTGTLFQFNDYCGGQVILTEPRGEIYDHPVSRQGSGPPRPYSFCEWLIDGRASHGGGARVTVRFEGTTRILQLQRLVADKLKWVEKALFFQKNENGDDRPLTTTAMLGQVVQNWDRDGIKRRRTKLQLLVGEHIGWMQASDVALKLRGAPTDDGGPHILRRRLQELVAEIDAELLEGDPVPIHRPHAHARLLTR